MELDLVDPVAVTVVGVQHRGVLVCQPAQVPHGARTGKSAQAHQTRIFGIRTERAHCFAQGAVVEESVVHKFGGLVRH